MKPEIVQAFSRVKSLCDDVMVAPSKKTLGRLLTTVSSMPKETVQEMQLYILFPIVTHLKSVEMRKKYELQRILVDAMKTILGQVCLTSTDIFIKYHNCIANLVFDKSQPGMVAQVPEELKLSVVQALVTMMLQLDDEVRLKLYHSTHVPLLAQTLFIVVHIAKIEKLRVLRQTAITCVMAFTATHYALMDSNYQIRDPRLAVLASDMVSSILPGVLSALQDVATCPNNPGQVVITHAVGVIHRIVCLVMSDANVKPCVDVTTDDFEKMFISRGGKIQGCIHSTKNGNTSTKLVRKSVEWYAMAGIKLRVVTSRLVSLRLHQQACVRKALAEYAKRVLLECSRTMQPSIPLLLDVLIALSEDEYPEVAQFCSAAIATYLTEGRAETRANTLDGLADNFHASLAALPRVLNNVDSAQKLGSLMLLRGHLRLLGHGQPSRLTRLLSSAEHLHALCRTLLQAARLDLGTVKLLAHISHRDIEAPVLDSSPWCKMLHVDDRQCECLLQEICQYLGTVDCADLIVDYLLDLFSESAEDRREIVYLLNAIGSGQGSEVKIHLVKRILNTYIEPDTWNMALEVTSSDKPVTSEETLDISVYNPRAWDKDSVPGLYEGTIETRYTDISYQESRVLVVAADADRCATLLEAQHNMMLSCLLTEGVGALAQTLMDHFQPFLYKTLCLVLERVGSKYEMLHYAGLKALHGFMVACRHRDVAELIRTNADYFTYQITTRLKRAWDRQSALQILIVVMEYSDASILTCLHDIVTDVLIKSNDYYSEEDVSAYLQVFLTFVMCIHKWFPEKAPVSQESKGQAESCKNVDIKHESTSVGDNNGKSGSSKDPVPEMNYDVNDKMPVQQSPKLNDTSILKETLDYIRNEEEPERLLTQEEFEKDTGKTVEEMYLEDLKQKKEEELNYEEPVSEEKPPLPGHIVMTVTVIRRSLNFIPSKQREEKLLALQVVEKGLLILRDHEDELLPLVHQAWAPLVERFSELSQPAVLREAINLLVTMALVSKDFIRQRAVKDVLPNIFKSLKKFSGDSYLKDTGSAYRASAAFRLQVVALSCLRVLVTNLGLEDTQLEAAMACAAPYLSDKQPKPLQALAVLFFQSMLDYDYGATWQHLRELCGNDCVLAPNKVNTLGKVLLEAVIGTPYKPKDKSYKKNIREIFNLPHKC